MIKRIITKLNQRKQDNLEKEIEKDLIKYYNRKITTRGITRKYGLKGQERNISYLLRTMNRKLNIAKAMEQEERIEKTSEILNNYKKEILSKIEIQEQIKEKAS